MVHDQVASFKLINSNFVLGKRTNKELLWIVDLEVYDVPKSIWAWCDPYNEISRLAILDVLNSARVDDHKQVRLLWVSDNHLAVVDRANGSDWTILGSHCDYLSVKSLSLYVPLEDLASVCICNEIFAVVWEVKVFDWQSKSLPNEFGEIDRPNMVNCAAFLVCICQKDRDFRVTNQSKVP